jgi:spermidine synthase
MPDTIALKNKLFYPLLFMMFLASGFCALLYQIVWVRLAFAAFGIITPILSVVISVFMLGLAVGSWAGGKFAERLSGLKSQSALLPYALMELLIGIGGLSVPFLFKAGRALLLPVGNFNSFPYLLLSGVVLAISILPWCVCMGATIPLLMKFIRQVHRGQTKGFSFLYMANVIGAMCGTLATAVFLIETLGLQRTLIVGVGLNFSIALLSLILSFVYSQESFGEPMEADRSPTPAGHLRDIKPGLALSVLFMTGFTSMAMEVAWTRAFTPMLQTTIYAFAGVLAVYLLATWLGSRLYRQHLRFDMVKSVPGLIAALAVVSLLPIAFSDPRLMRFNSVLVIEAMLLSIFPFCAALGYLTSKLIDDLSQGRPGIAGQAYAINAVGCILGPLSAGYVLLPLVGTKYTLILLAAPYGLYFLIFSAKLWKRGPVMTLLTGLLIGFLFFGSTAFLLSYEDLPLFRSGIIRRDYAGSVISYGRGLKKMLLVNGVGMTALTTITKSMAHIPLAVRDRKPDSALVICFGMGTTFRSAASWGIKVVAVELVPSVVKAFGYYFNDARQILWSANRRIVVDDGRRYLQRTLDLYDLIVIDPPPPVESSGSSLLYSEQFYQTAKMRLKPEGILLQWLPNWDELTLQAEANALRRQFPYVRVFASLEGWGAHFMASQCPFELPDAETFASRLPLKAARDFAEWTPNRTPAQLYQTVKDSEIPLDKILTPGFTLSLTDDRPINEYFLLRRLFQGQQVHKNLNFK